jgi:hypothetical protein
MAWSADRHHLGALEPKPGRQPARRHCLPTKPFLPMTLVNLLRQIITPQIIDPASSVG